MERIRELVDSGKSLKNTRVLVFCGLMVAMCFVLGLFSFYITPDVKVSFGYLPVAVTGMFFGPFAATLVGACNDILAYFTSGMGAFFPGYTLTAALTGLIFGIGLYNKTPSILRVAIVRAAIVLLLHLGLNTLWLTLTGGDAFLALLPFRALKSLLQYPIDVMLIWVLLRILIPLAQRAFGGRWLPKA